MNFAELVRERLASGKSVRRGLPDGGRIHVDRPLPFLCVHRQPPRRPDPGTESLVTGHASFLSAAGAKRARASVGELVDTFVDVARTNFGAVLLLEVWSGPAVDTAIDEPAVAAFRIHAADSPELQDTVDALCNGLGPFKVGRLRARVERPRRPATHPPGLPALGAGVPWIGIEVAPIWRRNGDEFFPLILRRLRRALLRAMQRACFRFTRDHTNQRPRHYQALGRRAWVKAASRVDERLSEIGEAYDFLLLMTPTNTEAAYEQFRRTGFRKAPHFLYRHMPIDPLRVKRDLFETRIEQVEDPTLGELFRQRQRELDLQLNVLADRPSPRVLLTSRQLYGGVRADLLAEAESILTAIPARAYEKGDRATAAEFVAAAQREFDWYRAVDPELPGEVAVRDDINGLMVSRGRLLVGRHLRIAASRVCPLIQHEIGMHVVTYRNGSLQPFRQLRHGLPGYEELQEGLAVLAEYLCGSLSRPRLRLLAARVVAVHAMIEGADFAETFRCLHERWSMPPRIAFGVVTRVHRGGGLPKDAAYLRGLRVVVDHLGGGARFEPLLVGKIAIEHVALVEELRRRAVLKKPRLRPRFLDLPGASERLARLRPGLPLLELAREEKS